MEYNRRESENHGMKKGIALITGGARGIGLEISRKLAVENWDIAICGRKEEEELQETLTSLRAMGTEVRYYQADISLIENHKKLLSSIEADLGTLNLLVNNAGVAPLKRVDILDASEESFERIMNINLKGPFFLTRDVARGMIENKAEGIIINIGSVSAEIASPSRGDYCISKAGIAMATKLWATRLAEFNITVFEVQPGIIKTDMTSAVTGKYDKMIDEGLLLQPRWGIPEDVGKTVASLARGDMAYSTGQMIRVDGGLSIKRL